MPKLNKTDMHIITDLKIKRKEFSNYTSTGAYVQQSIVSKRSDGPKVS
jgi:hypothetical protein